MVFFIEISWLVPYALESMRIAPVWFPLAFVVAGLNALAQVSATIDIDSTQVTLRLNGTAVSGTLPLQFIAGSDPAAVNTASSPNTVSIQTSTSANPVTVPAY